MKLCGIISKQRRVCRRSSRFYRSLWGERHSVAKTNAQGQIIDFRELVKRASQVAYGVELPDLYCDMVLSGRMRFREAVADFTSHDSEYPESER